ncbi:lipid-binding SYLF domain-containing protein [Verrucomicrobia bacterium]|jgi:lipid-binding SYLF domain-containing protein|nr:lipid-binding SYLF domain-containing protein [Verrucomicrobiota bacterium]MDB4798754.1 lipid-binding SYLF domain-containing protein [Verrucomicrobiota bacterium]
MNKRLILLVALLFINPVFESSSCHAAGLKGLFGKKSEAHKARALHKKVEEAVTKFKKKDPSMSRFFKKSVGYAVFPSVVKAGIGFGGAMGKGEVYEGGKLVGKSTMAQATVGFQFGGQAYSEIVFFNDEDTFSDFQRGSFEFGAQVSAVAVTLGASDNARFDEDMVVFTMEKGGLMYEATVGGQMFTYEGKD